MTFAGITVALVLGSVVDRMKFSSWIIFTVLWVTFIYCPDRPLGLGGAVGWEIWAPWILPAEPWCT